MRFEKLTHESLKTLLDQGYTVLTSNNNLSDDNVYWYPEVIEDLESYLFNIDNIPFQEKSILVIQDALKSIEEADLFGQVFI